MNEHVNHRPSIFQSSRFAKIPISQEFPVSQIDNVKDRQSILDLDGSYFSVLDRPNKLNEFLLGNMQVHVAQLRGLAFRNY
jgi:hypothetical protein